MPGKTFDPRESGKFTRIPGGKSDKGAADGDELGGPDQRKPLASAKSPGVPSAQQMAGRDPKALHDLGFHATVGYGASARAVDALHGSGDLQAMHHHGRALQESVKALKLHGAKPEEIERLRHGLTSLHSALTRNDRVGAHEALNNLRHGFYHAHAVFQKEFGPGGFPTIGKGSQAPQTSQPGQEGQPQGKPGREADPKAAAPKAAGPPKFQPSKAAMRAEEWPADAFSTATAGTSTMDVKPAASQQSPVTVNLHTAPVNHNVQDAAMQFKDILVEAMRATKPVQVNVPATQVSVQNKVAPTPVHVDVNPTPVKFEATVQPSEVKVVQQDAPKAPDVHVHVNPTPVTVEAKPGEVTVKLPERKPRDVEFKTDKDGKLIGMKEKA